MLINRVKSGTYLSISIALCTVLFTWWARTSSGETITKGFPTAFGIFFTLFAGAGWHESTASATTLTFTGAALSSYLMELELIFMKENKQFSVPKDLLRSLENLLFKHNIVGMK